MRSAGIAVIVSLAGAGLLGCPPADDRSALTEDESFFVMYAPNPDPIPLNELFTLTVMVHDGADRSTMLADAQLVIDATMPEHGHGMNTDPVVTAEGDGSFTVDGMKFQMPGMWELSMNVSSDGIQDSVTFEVDCCD